MEYSITNLAVDNIGENVYVKAFAEGVEMEQRENPLLVSVLFACYNHEKYVEAAIRSIMAQEGVKFELIVIDDGSSDSSPQILERLQKEFDFRYIHRPNKGLVATMNELLAMARGKYFCSFASDDIMPAGRLYKQSMFLMAHPDNVACFGQIQEMSEEGKISPQKVPLFMKNFPSVSFEEIFVSDKALHGCSEMLLTEAVRSLGGYDTHFHFEDMPLFFALLLKYGPQPVSRDFVCCYYREHESNLHNKYDKMYSEILRLLDVYRSHPLYDCACKQWKMRWFSALAYKNKLHAIVKLPELASFTPAFIKRLPKLLIPSFLLRH